MPPALYQILHRLGSVLLPSCLWRGDANVPVVALTFDDGPHPVYTPALLQVLARHGVTATFFLLGERVTRFPEVVRQIHEAGHGIGLHGFSHRPFPRLAPNQLRRDLEATQQTIGAACGLLPGAVRDVRPPGGAATPETVARLRAWGYRPVMWGAVSGDWACPGVGVVVRRTLAQTRAGTIIVLHDGGSGGRDVAAVADAFIPTLQECGYGFVTVDALRGQASNSDVG